MTDVLGLDQALAEPSQEDVNQMTGILSVRPDEVAAQISGRQVLKCDLGLFHHRSADCRILVLSQGQCTGSESPKTRLEAEVHCHGHVGQP